MSGAGLTHWSNGLILLSGLGFFRVISHIYRLKEAAPTT